MGTIFQPNHFVPILNDRRGTQRKDSVKSEVGWIKISHKNRTRKPSTSKSFLVTRNTRECLADKMQQSHSQYTQKSNPSQSQRLDHKALCASLSTNGSQMGNKQTASTCTSSSSLSCSPDLSNKNDDLNTSVPHSLNKNDHQDNSKPSSSPPNKNASESMSETDPSCKVYACVQG